MGSITAKLMLITIFSKITGLLREMIFGAAFGTSAIKDIYVISESLMAISFGFLFVAIETCFIPIYNKVLHESGRAEADRFTANLTNLLMILATVIIVLAFIFMEPLVKIVASGYTGEKFTQTVYFSRLTVVEIYFRAAFVCMISYLNTNDDFVTPALSGILSNISFVVFALLSARHQSLELLAFGTVISNGIRYVFFPRAAKRAGYRHRLLANPHDPNIQKALAIALPVMMGIVVNDLAIIFDKTIATTVAVNGGVSALDYADKIYQLIYGIVTVSVVTAAYPKMSRFGQSQQLNALKRTTTSSIVACLAMVIPAAIAVMAFVNPVVRAFYQRGAFTAESTFMTAGALFWYAPGLIATVFTNLLTRTFYALNDTKKPFYISMFIVAVNIMLNLILSAFFGLNGLAAATMIGNFTNAALLMAILHRKIGKLHFRHILISSAKIIAASGVMVSISLSLFKLLTGLIRELPALAVTAVFGALLYGIILLFTGIPEVKRLANQLYHRFVRKRRAI